MDRSSEVQTWQFLENQAVGDLGGTIAANFEELFLE